MQDLGLRIMQEHWAWLQPAIRTTFNQAQHANAAHPGPDSSTMHVASYVADKILHRRGKGKEGNPDTTRSLIRDSRQMCFFALACLPSFVRSQKQHQIALKRNPQEKSQVEQACYMTMAYTADCSMLDTNSSRQRNNLSPGHQQQQKPGLMGQMP